MSARRIALVCMTPEPDTNELGHLDLPSYGIRRILAAVVADPELASAKVALVDHRRVDVEAYVESLASFEPDLVGFSIYVWSTPCMIEVARRLKQRRPQCTVIFGGPSARTTLFDLAPYADAHTYLDAVVSTEGEAVFREIARLPELNRAALRSVPGLHLPASGVWLQTGHRAPTADLDAIASPFQLGLMPPKSVAYLETYRGCPLSCRFCEWGASETSRAVFSADYIARELEAFARQGSPSVFLLDAGLNLNARGFRNLLAAEERVGFLKSSLFWAEIYPTHIQDEHMEFLSRVGTSYLGVGLQSLDPAVLKLHDRPFDRARFEKALNQLISVTTAEVQIIFGLPGDSPAGFRRTLEYARSFPVAVRAYHCLVLPDALMSRGRPGWDMRYDTTNLAMQSCLGWSEEDILAMRAELDGATAASGGKSGKYWWSFPRRS
ncbi:MAG: radical SAM protein [Betaproteobacteria bacterium]